MTDFDKDTPSNGSKKPNKKESAATYDSESQSEAAAQKGKHAHFPLSIILRLLAILLAFIFLLCVLLYVVAGTEKGTRVILDTISSRTGVALDYGSGNIRDGLMLHDLELQANKDIEVHLIDAYVKIGWRALFAKEVHLRDANIGEIEVINHAPPSGKPFDYKQIKLPINLRFDKAEIGRFSYKQAQKKPIVLTDIDAKDLKWVGTKVSVDAAKLKYAEMANVTQLSGFIDLQDDYPLEIDTTVNAQMLDKLYIEPLDIQAAGSLKRMSGLLKSRYNQQDIAGEFLLQPMDKGTPLDVKLTWDELLLPYAQDSENIQLSKGLLTLSGVLSNIDLRINTDLSATHIPSGRYQGRASVIDKQMLVEFLAAQTPNGRINAQGVLDWEQDFTAKAMLRSNDYKLAGIVPTQAEPYAPKTLDGRLAVVFDLANKNGLMQIDADLQQRDGEHLNAEIIRGVKPDNPRFKAPWMVDAAWENLRRSDVPNIGNINSPSGQADVTLRDNRLWVTADARIEELNAAPAGDYHIKLAKVNDDINLQEIDYNGLIGQLDAVGNIQLARGDKPLTWQIQANTQELLPQLYKEDLPVERLVGRIDAKGRMKDLGRTVNGNTIRGQQHIFTINDIDMTATLNSDVDVKNVSADSNQNSNKNTERRRVAITGRGAGNVVLINNELKKFDVRFNGQLNTQGLPKGDLIVDVESADNNAQKIIINKLIHNGETGLINAAGQVNLTNGITWGLAARMEAFNVGFFTEQTEALVTGRLKTSGSWRDDGTKLGNLQAFNVNFNGSVDTPELPQGTLVIDAGGNANDININKFRYQGDAGSLTANGSVKVRQGIQWDIAANAQKLNVDAFVPQTDAIVSGQLKTSGTWQDNGKTNNTASADQNALQNLQALNLKFNGSIDTPSLPPGQLTIDASGNADAINLRQFRHRGEAGSLLGKGRITLQDGIGWNISAAMDDYNLGYFVEDMPSAITGNIKTSGVWRQDVQRVNIDQMSLNGRIKGQQLTATGRVQAVLHLPQDMDAYLQTIQNSDTDAQFNQVNQVIETLQVDNVVLRFGNNRIVADGNAKRLQADVNISDLSQIVDDLTGKVTGGMTVVQQRSQALPTIYVDISGNNLTLPNLTLRQGSIKGKIADLGKGQSSLAIIAKGLQTGNLQVNNLVAAFKGTQDNHSLSLKATATRDDTPIDIRTLIKGGLADDAASWRGVIGKGRVATPFVLLVQNQPAQLIADWSKQNPQVKLAAHCWQATDQSGKLCLRSNLIASAVSGQVDMAIQKLDTTLFVPFLPDDLTWKATVNGKVLAKWQQGQKPQINTTIYSDNGVIGMTQEGAAPVTLPYKRISLIAQSVAQGLKIRTDIDSGRGASGYADVVIDPYSERKSITGEVILNEFNLGIVKPFFPGMRQLNGNVMLDASLSGMLSKPIINGEAKLTNAQVAILDLPVDLKNINATASINGQSSVINGSFMSGDGTGYLEGSLNWRQDLQAKLRVHGERLFITQPPLYVAEVSPDINVIVKPVQKYVSITGAVSIPEATIRPPEANEEVITKSEDVVVLDRRLIGNLDEVLAISEPWSINANIGVDLGEEVNFRGFGAVLPLAGALHITQQGQGTMMARGVIQVSRRTEVDAFGRNLELNYAQIRFDGNVMNPDLSIEAATDVEDNTVGVRIKGNVANPNISIFNDAGLTQQQAINALVTGRLSSPSASQTSEEGFKSRVTNSLAAAGLNVGFQGTRGLTNSIGQAFGLQRLTLGASGGADDTNVNITGYITPDLYIRYGVGVFNAQSELSLRYQLTNRIYIEATSAIEDTVDAVYSFQF